MQPATQSLKPSRTIGDHRHRFLRHHVPLALVSAVVLVLFMTLPTFAARPPGNIFTDWFPREDFSQQPGAGQRPMDHAGGQIPQQGAGHQIPQQHVGGQMVGRGGGSFLGLSVRQLTFATGYVAIGLLALTLLIGPGKLLLRRRNPVSSYLTRDVGTWTAIFSVVHVIFGLEVHASVTDPLPMFRPLGTSFGLANWTGLAATVIVVGLLAISSDFALQKLKARTWKNLQRLNYALFALVIAHAFFYGVMLRTGSPYTLLLLLSVIAVFAGQTVGVWLWRRRHSRRTVSQPA